MPNTPVYGIPYQSLGDPPHGPNLGQALALEVEAELVRIDAAAAGHDTEINALQALVGIKDLDGISVAASDTLGASAYVDLATPGPAVTLDTGTKALVIVTAKIFVTNVANIGRMSFAVSGASSIAAADGTALGNNTLTPGKRASAMSLITTLTPGVNTFTAKYSSTGSTTTFSDRQIAVIGFA